MPSGRNNSGNWPVIHDIISYRNSEFVKRILSFPVFTWDRMYSVIIRVVCVCDRNVRLYFLGMYFNLDGRKGRDERIKGMKVVREKNAVAGICMGSAGLAYDRFRASDVKILSVFRGEKCREADVPRRARSGLECKARLVKQKKFPNLKLYLLPIVLIFH